MEVSPAKSLGIVSDSEGEEDGARSTFDLLEYEPNAVRLAGPRDWHHLHNAATIATNSSSELLTDVADGEANIHRPHIPVLYSTAWAASYNADRELYDPDDLRLVRHLSSTPAPSHASSSASR
jgi:hypothetical protein